MLHARVIGASVLTIGLALAGVACGDDDEAADDETTEETTTTAGAGEATTTTAGDAAEGAITVQTAESELGTILVDGEGNTLYGFTVDTAGTPTCSGGCASAWPALIVEGEPVIGEGLDASLFTTVSSAEGGMQLKAGDWPLYRFTQDTAPGETNGQGSGGVWFVVRPDGTLIEQ